MKVDLQVLDSRRGFLSPGRTQDQALQPPIHRRSQLLTPTTVVTGSIHGYFISEGGQGTVSY